MQKRACIFSMTDFNSMKAGLLIFMVILTPACSNRPTHFIPPNRADAIMDVSKVEVEETGDILGRITDASSRNIEQLNLLAISDIYCGDFISSIYGRRAVTNVWYSTITTATAAAAAIVGGRAAQNLAGTSAVTNEMRSSINNEMYGGELIPTVAKEIMGMRKVELTRIIQLQTTPIAKYSGSAAIADAIGYHELCSIPIAISNILSRANQKYGVSTLDLDGSIQKLDNAIAANKALLNDPNFSKDSNKQKELTNNILELTERRNALIKTFAIPGYQSTSNDGQKPVVTPDPPVDASSK